LLVIYPNAELSLLGYQLDHINPLINSGKITGVNSKCPVECWFEGGRTYVASKVCTCTTYLVGDLNYDCYIDIDDLVLLAGDWLSCTDPLNEDCL